MKNVLREFFSMIPLTVLAASALTAGVTQLWWVVLMGLAAAMIIAVQSALAADEKLPRTPSDQVAHDLSRLGSRQRRRFQALLDKKSKILQALEGLEESPFLDSQDVAARVEDLIGSYYQLLIKLQDIVTFLDQKTVGKVQRSVKTLKQRMEQCNDQVTRENLRHALHNKTDELSRILELQKYSERIDSQLVSMATALNSIYTAIVQIKVSPDASGGNAQEVTDRMSALLLEVDISEKVIREINQLSRNAQIEQA